MEFIDPGPPCTSPPKERSAYHAALTESRAISELPMSDQYEFNRHLEEARAAQALEPWSTIIQKFPELTDMTQKFVPEWYSCCTMGDDRNNRHGENTQTSPNPECPLVPHKVPRSPLPHHYPITGLHSPEQCKAFTHLRQYPFAAMTNIRGGFYNLKLAPKAIALRKIWVPLDQSNNIAFGQENMEVTWTIFAFTSYTANDIGAPGLLHLTLCKAAEKFCPGSGTTSKWSREVTSATNFLGNLQAVGSDPLQRYAMMTKVANIIRSAKMKPGP